MKSSAGKLVLIFSLIILPLIVWAILTGPSQDVRSRATVGDAPTLTETPPNISLTPSTTPSATPSVTPSTTPTITPTPTNMPPACLGLSANPGAGSKPLTVSFACAGYDANNDITAAEFGFGAGQKSLVEKNVGQYGSLTTTFTYTSPGSYNVTCRIRDNNNGWSNYPSYCTYTVVVSDNELTPTPYRTPYPTQAIGMSDDGSPVILNGALPTLARSPTVIPTRVPTISLPTQPPAPGLWTNDKVRQLFIMLVVSAVTVIVALMLHSFFDRR